MNNEYNNINPNNSIEQPVIMPTQQNNRNTNKINIVLIITNIITLIALIACVVLYSPLFNKKDETKTENKQEINYTKTVTDKPVSNNWKDYQFGINGKTLTLPCSYRELKDVIGFHMKSSDEKSYTDPLMRDTINLYETINGKEEHAAYIDIKNRSEEDGLNANLDVTRISQTSLLKDENETLLIFPGNLKVGMTYSKEDAIKQFGEPTTIREYNFSGSTTIGLEYIEDENNSTINYYKIEIINGKIEELMLDHYRVKE